MLMIEDHPQGCRAARPHPIWIKHLRTSARASSWSLSHSPLEPFPVENGSDLQENR